jgi:hypothetical protein
VVSLQVHARSDGWCRSLRSALADANSILSAKRVESKIYVDGYRLIICVKRFDLTECRFPSIIKAVKGE